MSLDIKTIKQLAEYLESAELEVRDVVKITDAHPEMIWNDAYAIQDEVRLRKEARGIKTIGFKAGLTSLAKMKQMGVDTPVFGFLSDYFAVPDGEAVKMDALIHPKAEPEIAFVLKRALKGPGCSIDEVLAATDFVIPAIELIDSRYRNFKFDLTSVIADNCSSSRFVVGGRRMRADELDLGAIEVTFEKNGETVARGTGAAVLGHPAAAVAMLANMLGQFHREIPARAVVLSGAITEAIAVKAGDNVTSRVQNMGSVSLRFV